MMLGSDSSSDTISYFVNEARVVNGEFDPESAADALIDLIINN